MNVDNAVKLIEAVGKNWVSLIVLVVLATTTLAWKYFPQLIAALKDWHQHTEALEEIRHQVTSNSGTSMKDAVDRVEAKLNAHLEESARDSALLHDHIDRAQSGGKTVLED